MENIEIKVEKMNEDAVLPRFQNDGDAGMDLVSNVDGVVKAMSFACFGTGLKFEIPKGYEIQIRPRSGLASKHGISVLNTPGTIDSGYRGEVKVILFNFSSTDFTVTKGMRIAQMVVSKLDKFSLVESAVSTDTERGEGGFGSTGTK